MLIRVKTRGGRKEWGRQAGAPRARGIVMGGERGEEEGREGESFNSCSEM